MSTADILIGIGLIVALAVSCQVLASRLRIPVLVPLLLVGFLAGALIPRVDGAKILGSAFQPLVSAAVAVIVYDGCLRINLRFLTSHTRRIVTRLVAVGIPVTAALGAVAAGPMLGLSRGGAVLAGTILAITGPSALGPILVHVQPAERLRHVLYWESALTAPIGGILALIAFYALLAGDTGDNLGAQAAEFTLSIGTGIAGALVATAVLWAALRRLRLPRTLMPAVQFAVIIAVASVCDAIRADSGLLAAILTGLALANLPNFRVPGRRLLETLVQPLLSTLLLVIAASVSPASLRSVWIPTLGLLGAMVLIVRPLVAIGATRGTDLTRRERVFAGCLAPRGITAATIAAAITGPLASHGIPEARKILPMTYLFVVATVILYGITAKPVSQWLGVLRSPRSRPLLVGGEEWVIDLGRTLQTLGLDVLMWAGLENQREQIRQAALQLAPGRLLASVTAERSELTGITTVLLLTAEDDFNALAALVLRYSVGDEVYRVGAPTGGRGVVAPYTGGRVLFSPALNRSTLASRYAEGARIVARQAGGEMPIGHELLFVVHADGRLDPATRQRSPSWDDGDTVVLLSTTGA